MGPDGTVRVSWARPVLQWRQLADWGAFVPQRQLPIPGRPFSMLVQPIGKQVPIMSSISVIGTGTMARILGARTLAGGNIVEVIGRDPAKAAALAYASGVQVVGQYGTRWPARPSSRSPTPSTRPSPGS